MNSPIVGTAGSPMASSRPAPSRDPAWVGRLAWTVTVLVLLWPLGVATEFKPWVLFERDNLKVTRDLLASFLPLAHERTNSWQCPRCQSTRNVAPDRLTPGTLLQLRPLARY